MRRRLSARRRVVVGVTLAVTAALSSCGADSILGPMVEGDVAAQRAKWQAQGIDDYLYRVTYGNAWVAPMTSLVEVKNGAVIRCHESGTNAPRDVGDVWLCPTMDQLFDRAEFGGGYLEGWVLDVRYDAALGLVRSIVADVPGVADEEFSYRVEYFARR